MEGYYLDDYSRIRVRRSGTRDIQPIADWTVEADNDVRTTTTPADPDNGTTLSFEVATNATKHKYEFYKTEQLAFLYVLLVLIVAGNVAVLVAIFLSKKRKSRMNFFIMQLAIADLLSGLVIVSTEIATKTTEEWHAETEGCKFIKYLESVVLFASTYVLVALSIDRLDAIAKPMNFSGSGTRAKILVVAAWGLSFAFSIPMLVLFEQRVYGEKKQCHLNLPHWGWKLYITTLVIILFIIPAIIIGSCYSVIISVIWRKSSLSSTNVRNGHSHGRHTLHESRTSGQGLIPKARIKTVKMTLVIVFAFVLCWSPFFIFNVLDVYGLIPMTQEKIAISIFIQSLSSLNSAANPVIYCLFSTRICQNWRTFPMCDRLARTLCCCTSEVSPSRHPGSITNGTDFTSVATDGRMMRPVNTCRRHSGTPYVRVTLTERENEILLRRMKTPEHKVYTNESDGDNVSENVSSV